MPLCAAACGATIRGEHWRWRAQGNYENLPPQLTPGQSQTRSLFDCSLEGPTVAGLDDIYPNRGDMFRLQIDTAAPAPQPRAADFPTSYVYFTTFSGDRLVLGGTSRRPTTSPFLSDTQAGVVAGAAGPLVITPESSQSSVNDLTINDSVAVGMLQDGASVRAFRWDVPGGLVFLDVGSSSSRAVSLDNTVVVDDYLIVGLPGTPAFIWTAAPGMIDLRELLLASHGPGSTVADWQLLAVIKVSADGQSIVDEGVNPDGCKRAFLVRLPLVPGTTVGDARVGSGPAGVLSLTPERLPYAGAVTASRCTGAEPDARHVGMLGMRLLSLPLAQLTPDGQTGCELLTSPDLSPHRCPSRRVGSPRA